MTLFEAIHDFIVGKKSKIEVPDGYCPNCWGKQEYEGKFIEAMKVKKIDLNNIDLEKGWIQAHAVKHFEGIKLQKTNDVFQCPNCKLIFKTAVHHRNDYSNG